MQSLKKMSYIHHATDATINLLVGRLGHVAAYSTRGIFTTILDEYLSISFTESHQQMDLNKRKGRDALIGLITAYDDKLTFFKKLFGSNAIEMTHTSNGLLYNELISTCSKEDLEPGSLISAMGIVKGYGIKSGAFLIADTTAEVVDVHDIADNPFPHMERLLIHAADVHMNASDWTTVDD